MAKEPDNVETNDLADGKGADATARSMGRWLWRCSTSRRADGGGQSRECANACYVSDAPAHSHTCGGQRANSFRAGNQFCPKGDFDHAIAEFDEAIRLDPNYAEAYRNRGNAYDDKGDLERALSNYNHALQLQPDNAQVYYDRGVAYQHKGDLDHALEDYNKAIQMQPNAPNAASAYVNRGQLYFTQGDLARALTDFSQAIQLKPDHVNAYLLRAAAYQAKGDNTKAHDDLTKAAALTSDPELKRRIQQALQALEVQRTESAKAQATSTQAPSSAPAQVGGLFMETLKNGNWLVAYSLCTTDLQKELGSADQLGKRITAGRAQPTAWTFEKVDLGTDEAQLDGSAAYTGNRSGLVRLVLDKVGSGWQISGFNLLPK